MIAEQIHRKKLQELGYKEDEIERLVTLFWEQNKYGFAEDCHKEQLKLLGISGVSISFERNELAKDILIALLQNPERYKYITKEFKKGKITQEEANLKNINKAFKIADSFLERI